MRKGAAFAAPGAKKRAGSAKPLNSTTHSLRSRCHELPNHSSQLQRTNPPLHGRSDHLLLRRRRRRRGRLGASYRHCSRLAHRFLLLLANSARQEYDTEEEGTKV
ncbi:hypothetical protein ABZP36_022930 [Zizania latifolia]